LYGIIIGTGQEASEDLCLSYEGLLERAIDHLLSDEQVPLTFWRRCCSSVHRHTMSVEECNQIRTLAGGGSDVRMKLDTAVNNWYLKGEISLSSEGLVPPPEHCGVE
jgi:hypothetical protein